MAALRLGALEDLASSHAWQSLERYLGIVLRQNLAAAVDRLQKQAAALQAQWNAASTLEDIAQVQRMLWNFRGRYQRTEILLDFYADALNTRTNPTTATLLRACDVLARRSMSHVLDQLGYTTPPVLTYIDKGLGASILKAGLRLWDGRTESLIAAIKITRHNLYRPTALVHEAGHQVAHVTGWSEELASALAGELSEASPALASMWASWASEITADAFAFAHTGYAAVAGLHDVIAGGETLVLRYTPRDPHPISYLRVLLGTHMCRQCFGSGAWDDLAQTWMQEHPVRKARSVVQPLLQQSLRVLPKVVELALFKPMRAFRSRSLVAMLDPRRVSPATLGHLEQQGGAALYTSHHWVWTEPLRLLALTGYRAATQPECALDILQQQKDWKLQLGAVLQTPQLRVVNLRQKKEEKTMTPHEETRSEDTQPQTQLDTSSRLPASADDGARQQFNEIKQALAGSQPEWRVPKVDAKALASEPKHVEPPLSQPCNIIG